jgi:hypothetical protein
MISVGLEGVKDAFDVFRELIVPAFRKQAARKVSLDNSVTEAQIQYLNAQTMAEKAKGDRDRAGVELDHAQVELLLAQATRTEAEAEFLRAQAAKTLADADVEREKMDLERIKVATQIVEDYAPALAGPEKIAIIMRLLPEINQLLESEVTQRIASTPGS